MISLDVESLLNNIQFDETIENTNIIDNQIVSPWDPGI